MIRIYDVVDKIINTEKLPINAAKKLSGQLLDHTDEQIRMRARIAYEACTIASTSIDKNDIDVVKWSLQRLGQIQRESADIGPDAERMALIISRTLCHADLFTPDSTQPILDGLSKFTKIDPTLSAKASEAGRAAVASGSHADAALALNDLNAVIEDFAKKIEM